MTELLQRLIAELEKLPDDEQDAIATRLLAELEDERAWKFRFESTTNEQWERLAQRVPQETVERPAIIQTERGLTIAGTRITLYDVMDFLTANYPSKLIREKLSLTHEQLYIALSYIEEHHTEVEAEYQTVLQTREEIRQYWEDRNREHLARIAAIPPKLGQEALRAKLQAWKARIESGA